MPDLSALRAWRLSDTADKALDGVEFAADLVGGVGWRIEWIVSRGQSSDWYDQDEDEWVVVLSGAARILIEHEDDEREMGPGDALWLPAHRRHRVTWTDPDQATVWCAVFVS